MWNELAPRAYEILNLQLFTVAGTTLTVASVVSGVIAAVLGWLITKLIDRAARRALMRRTGVDEGAAGAALRLLRWVLLLLTLSVSLEFVGIDISALFAAGAIFAVGLGFAMQNIAQNFVSGVILLVERTIRPGDVLHVDGRMVRVMNMGIRATLCRTRDEEELIIPNSHLVQGTVTNYKLNDPLLRLRVVVGVHYGSDMRAVREVLQRVGNEFDDRLDSKQPVVILREFGDSSVVWELSVWSERPWDERQTRGRVLEAVWFGLKDANITIAFPQVDVHFDEDVASGIAALSRSAA